MALNYNPFSLLPRSEMLYQATKEVTKFAISGVIAVMADFSVYYGLGVIFTGMENDIFGPIHGNDIFKACGFLAGTVVTYNMNKYWTWRQNDKNNRRLRNFILLYTVAFVINISVNRGSIHYLPDNEMALITAKASGDIVQWMAFKTDKLFAFLIATMASASASFTGQKLWVFRKNGEE